MVDVLGLFTINLAQLTVPAIIVGALIDSVNPCAIGVLIFLAAYLLKVFPDRKRYMLLGGVLYVATVYVTYFLAGLGLLSAIQNVTAAYYFYWIAAFIAFSAGTLEIKDFFWYGKGMSLQLFPGTADRIEQWTTKIRHLSTRSPKLALAATIPIGFGAAAFELPCTGQVYLAILALMNQTVPTDATGVERVTTILTSEPGALLALYNLIFVAPLIIITVLMYFGVSSDRMEAWRKRNRRKMRLLIGVFLYLLGGLLLWYLHTELSFGPFLQEITFLLFTSQVVFFAYIFYQGYFD